MKMLFIGHVVDSKSMHQYEAASEAGNQMQLGFLKALKQKIGNDLSIVSYVPLPIFPKSMMLKMTSKMIELDEDLNAFGIRFLNLPFFKSTSVKRAIHTYIKSWATKYKEEEKVILTFNALSHLATPVIQLKKTFHYHTFCIFADPPIDPYQRQGLAKLYKDIEFKQAKNIIKAYDGIIALNEKIVHDFAPKTPYELIEGGIDPTLSIEPSSNPNQDVKKIVYTGALTIYSGCLDLIEAISYLNIQDVRFEFYGDGPMKTMIIEKQVLDPRIIYGGKLSHQAILDIQKNADFLINPRKIDDPISQYTFPSKLLEYLSSGTPTISTKLNGLTSFYLDYIEMIDGSDAKALALSLLSILSKDYTTLKRRALEARNAVYQEKNWSLQTEKLLSFIYRIQYQTDESK